MKLCITVTSMVIALSVVAPETENVYMKSIRRYADAVLANNSEKIDQAKLEIEQVRYDEKRRVSDILTTDLSLLKKRNTSDAKVGATPDEEAYVRLYGNDVNTSGTWPHARELAADETILKHISLQAHNLIWPHPPHRKVEVKDAVLETKTLTFPNTEYKDIVADMIFYTLRPFPSYSVLTKGLRPDCVFLCLKVGNRAPRIFQLKNHVCGIEM